MMLLTFMKYSLDHFGGRMPGETAGFDRTTLDVAARDRAEGREDVCARDDRQLTWFGLDLGGRPVTPSSDERARLGLTAPKAESTGKPGFERWM